MQSKTLFILRKKLRFKYDSSLLRKEAINTDGYELFIISYNEAMRIDKGEAVNEYPGAIPEDTVKLIQEKGDKSQFVEISKE